MCLAVYIGCNNSLAKCSNVSNGGLDIEPAAWIPAPVKRFKYVYYVGSRYGAEGEPLHCSCLLMEYIFWGENGPEYEGDQLFENTETDPFEALQGLLEQAFFDQNDVMLVCDDGGGGDQSLCSGDYHSQFLRLDQIQKGNMIFSDPLGEFPLRSITVLPETIFQMGTSDV